MKVVVLTASRFGTASACLKSLQESEVFCLIGVVVANSMPPNPGHIFRRKLMKVLRIGPLGALNGIRMRGWYEGPPGPDLRNLCEQLGVPYFETDSTNSNETAELFRRLAPDLGLSLGNGYISPRIFRLPRFGMINVHGEMLPKYQNAQSVIWPIYCGETKTGLTIHQVDTKIDTGDILYQEEFPIIFCSRLKDTVRRSIEITRRQTPAAVRYVCENYERLTKTAKPQVNGRRYTTPSIWQFWRMVRNNKRLNEGGNSSGSWAKK